MFKYHAKKVVVDNITFDSESESRRYLTLKQMEKNKEIFNLKIHPVFNLQPSFIKNNQTFSPINYEADFSYSSSASTLIVEDVKGFETDDFKILRKLFEYKYPEYSLNIIKEYKGEFISEEEYDSGKRDRLLKKRQERNNLKREIAEWNKGNQKYLVNIEKASGSTYRKVQSDIKKMKTAYKLAQSNKKRDEKDEEKKKKVKKMG